MLARFDMVAIENGWSEKRIRSARDCHVSSSSPSSVLSDLKNVGASSSFVTKKASDGLPSLEGRAFVRAREEQAASLARGYADCGVFQGAESVRITWSKRLNKTAGLTKCMRLGEARSAEIELATKVVDSTAKLRCTPAHEMCHAAAWLEDASCKPPHGDCFKKWAHKFETALTNVTVSTTHNYDINYKFEWECSGCGQCVKRHSKSFDTEKFKCGSCGERFIRIK